VRQIERDFEVRLVLEKESSGGVHQASVELQAAVRKEKERALKWKEK
jgi:hypothetical protein